MVVEARAAGSAASGGAGVAAMRVIGPSVADRAEPPGDDAGERQPPHRIRPVRPAGIDPESPGVPGGARAAGDVIGLAGHVGGAAPGAPSTAASGHRR